MKKLVIISVTLAAALLIWIAISRAGHTLVLKTYFQNAQDLKRGTPVWVDGVEVGRVTSVRIRTEGHEQPVEVEMKIRTPYELMIPVDSVARIAARTVLGPTVINIDTHQASGPAFGKHDVLKSDEAKITFDSSSADLSEKIGNLLLHKAQERREQSSRAAQNKQ